MLLRKVTQISDLIFSIDIKETKTGPVFITLACFLMEQLYNCSKEMTFRMRLLKYGVFYSHGSSLLAMLFLSQCMPLVIIVVCQNYPVVISSLSPVVSAIERVCFDKEAFVLKPVVFGATCATCPCKVDCGSGVFARNRDISWMRIRASQYFLL